MVDNFKEKRAWGEYENLLDVEYCKVKKIIVAPGSRPSYQYHHKRSEHWVIVSGTAAVTLDGKSFLAISGQHVHVPVGTKHRIENTSQNEELIFIEVQCGTYFGEDDIVRISDDYSRVR
jgi:mannose-6-phosphate isomerase-like protein (cupin superfamily)